MPEMHAPQQNHLLAAWPTEDYERILPNLELVSLALGQVLYESDVQMRYVYFPVDSTVSLLNVMEDGSPVEIAIVGNEGLVGISLLIGGQTTPDRAMVKTSGYAYRLEGLLLKDVFFHADLMQQQLLRYTQALLSQMAHCCVIP